MIELMESVWESSTSNISLPELMDNILMAQEKAGMIPPETIRYVDQDNGNTSCIPECAWDIEDES